MGDMDPNRLKEGQNAARAAQSGKKKPKREGGVFPTIKKYGKKPFSTEFWVGKEGAQGAEHGKEHEKNVRENDPDYGTGGGQDTETTQSGEIRERKGNKFGGDEAYNSFIAAFIDVITRGHSRTDKDEPNKIFSYVTAEEFIKAVKKREKETPAETEGYNDFYREGMIKQRADLAKKLRNKNVNELNFQEIDVLLVTMLNNEKGAETFLEFLHDVAKMESTPEKVGEFIGGALLTLRTLKSTASSVEKEIQESKKKHEYRLETILSPSIANAYFEANSYPVIREAVSEFEKKLSYEFNPADLPPEERTEYEKLETKEKREFEKRYETMVESDEAYKATKKRMVDSFRRLLLSDPAVIEDGLVLENRMPATYKKNVEDKVNDLKALISDIGAFKGSELRKERLDKRIEKLEKEITGIEQIDDNLREILLKKITELKRLYEKKQAKIKDVKVASIKISSISEEMKEEDKKKIEELNRAKMELENVDSDIDLLTGEIDTESNQENEMIKTAKDIVKKLKDSVTEEDITKDQYVIAAIIYEGGVRKIGDIEESREVNIHEKRRLDRVVRWILGKLTKKLDIEEERILFKKWWRNSDESKIERRYTIARTLSILAWPAYGSHFSKWLKKNWHMKAFGFGIVGAMLEDRRKFSKSRAKIKAVEAGEDFIGKEEVLERMREERKTQKTKKIVRWFAWPVIIAGTWITTAAAIDSFPWIGTKHWSEKKKDEKGVIMPRIARALNVSRESFREVAFPVPLGLPWKMKSWKVKERHPESERKKTEMSVLGDINTQGYGAVKKEDLENIGSSEYLNATKDRKFMLQLYYPGLKQSEIDEKGSLKALNEKEKQYKEQLEWLQNHPEVADFLAERKFGVKLIEYAKNGETIHKEKSHRYNKFGKVDVTFGKGEIKDSLRLNPNKTPEFIAELMAIEQGMELVNTGVNRELKDIGEDSGVYREMAGKHGEPEVAGAIEGHIIGLIINAMSVDKDEAKEAKKELAGYGIGFDKKGKLEIQDDEKLKTAVVENVVKKIEEYGIEYFNDEIKLSKASINHKYLYKNLRNWEDKEYIIPKDILGYMNTYGITSVENAGFLMANPDVQGWLGKATVKGHATIYIPEENVEKVVDKFRERAKKATEGVGVVTVLSESKRLSITAAIENSALKEELAVDTTEEYTIHLEEKRIAEELGEGEIGDVYPESQELINYLRRNEVKSEWFDYLYGEKTSRDKTEIKNELIAYLEGQKKQLASNRAKRIDEELASVESEMKELELEYELAETDEERTGKSIEMLELAQRKEYLEQEKKDPEKYINNIINYIKYGVKEEETEGIMTEEAQALLAMEREAKKMQAINYLENARKERDIKYMLSTYRKAAATAIVNEDQLDDFIRYVLKHIEKGGRASDFNAFGNTEMNRRYLEHAKKEGYLRDKMVAVSTVDGSGIAIKEKINTHALDMCEPITMKLDNVFEHMAGKEGYHDALESEGEDGLKRIAKAFMYKKIEQTLDKDKTKSEKMKNELLANGVKFNSKTGKAEIADAEKLADYIYEGKIKEAGVSAASEELIENSKALLSDIDKMMEKQIGQIMKKKDYSEEQVLNAMHGYLMAQLSAVQQGDIVMQDKLTENGIEFDDEGIPGITEDKNARKYVMSEILKPMMKFGIENVENRTDKIKQTFEVSAGETMGEDVMSTPEETKEERALEGLDYSNGVQTFVDKNDPSKIYVKFTKDGDYRDLYMTPREAIEEVRKNKKIKKVEKGPMLVNKEGKPVYKFEVMYDAGIVSKQKPATAYVPSKGIVKIEQ